MRKEFTYLNIVVFVVMSTLTFGQQYKDVQQYQAAPADSTDLYKMSIEELMNIKVVSSTKREINIQKAPSVIRLFTKDDIQKMGFQTVREILDQIPGFEIQEYRAGHQLTWIRGVQARYNNKVLLLIDGIPMRDSYYGNFNIDKMIPIEIVERVEIINGPGSVLYGANSFSGVVSITTKQEGKSIGIDAGSFNSLSVNGQYSFKGFFANASVFRTDGFSPDLNSDGKVRVHDQSATNQSFLASYNNGPLQLTASYTNYQYPYTYRESKSDFRMARKPLYGSAAYTFKLGDYSSIKVQSFVNMYGFTIDKTKFTATSSNDIKEVATEYLNTSLYGANLEYFFKMGKNEIVAGTSFLSDHARNIRSVITNDEGAAVNIEEAILKTSDGDLTRNNIGFFMQNSYHVLKNLSITTGVRYDLLNKFDDQLNYRIGITGSFSDHLYGKILYGTAYRVPAYREYIDVGTYNDNLKPEKLKTLEAQFGYMSTKMDINLTMYNNYYSDFISEVVVDSIASIQGVMREVDDEVSFNFDNRSITGLELNGVIKPTSQLHFIVGLSYKFKATEKLGDFRSDETIFTSEEIDFSKRDLTFLSKFTGNFSAAYSFAKRIRIVLGGQYFSDRNTPSDYQANVPAEAQNASNAKGFFKLNFSSNINIVKGLSVNASINNILDTKIYSPPYRGQQDYDAQWPGRVFRAGIQYQF